MVWFRSDTIRYYHYSKIDILVYLHSCFTITKLSSLSEQLEVKQRPSRSQRVKNLCPVHQRLTVVISTTAEEELYGIMTSRACRV